jgi:DNA-binding HxlR family transcriptional regulator
MVLKKFTWPAELTLTLIGGKWKGLILNHLLTGESKRFGELKRLSGGISAKILAKHLKELEFDGLITRMVVGTDKPRIVYAPTLRSRSLAPVLSAIQQWGEEHLGVYGPGEQREAEAKPDSADSASGGTPIPSAFRVETPPPAVDRPREAPLTAATRF